MSDVTAAPAEAVAPTNTPTPDAGKPPAPPKEAVPPQAELEAVLKKMGGLEVRAGGKTHKVDSLEKLQRYIQRGLPVEQSLEEVARAKAEVEPIKALLAQLQSGDDEAAESALERLLDSGKLDKVAERRLRRQFEKEQSMQGMSEREKALAQQLESERSEKTRLAEERKRFEDAQRQQQEAQQVNAIKAHIGNAITKTLEGLGLPDKLEPLAVEFMKPIIRASLNAGMALDPAVLTEKVRPVLDQLFEYQVSKLEGDALVKRLGPDVGKRYRAALLAQLNGGTAKPAPVETKQEAPAPAERWDPRRRW